MSIDAKPASDRDLVLSRLIPAPRAKIYRAWTEPELLAQWFAPRPFTTTVQELDVLVGGRSVILMKGPDGNEFPTHGVYLAVVPERRLVMTDAYVEAWVPSEKPFITIDIDLTDEAGGTRYVATARHWTVADREAHEAMGFHQGWGQCADQLTELVRTL